MAKFYALNTIARSGKTGYGNMTVGGRLVVQGTRIPLEESQLEDEYDKIKKLWDDGVIEIRVTETGQVFTFPEKIEPEVEAKPELDVRSNPPEPELEPEPDPSELDNVVSLPAPERPRAFQPHPDSLAESPLQDLLNLVKEPEKTVEEPKSSRKMRKTRKG